MSTPLIPSDGPVPTDYVGKEIKVGSKIIFPVKAGGAGNGARIVKGTVQLLGEPSHQGYGYITIPLKVKSEDDGKIKTVQFPKNVWIFDW